MCIPLQVPHPTMQMCADPAEMPSPLPAAQPLTSEACAICSTVTPLCICPPPEHPLTSEAWASCSTAALTACGRMRGPTSSTT